MPRFIHRRVIVFVVLFCQLLAVGVVHVPMAQAASVPAAAATSAHCHDNAPNASSHAKPANADVTVAATHAMGTGHATDTSDPAGHHCKSGFCACVCAHAPAGVAETSVTLTPQVSRPPLMVIDSVHSAPERATAFFRPPI